MNNFFENSNKNNYVKQRSQFIINPTNYQDKYKNYNNIKPELKENVVVVKLKENSKGIWNAAVTVRSTGEVLSIIEA